MGSVSNFLIELTMLKVETLFAENRVISQLLAFCHNADDRRQTDDITIAAMQFNVRPKSTPVKTSHRYNNK